MIDKLCLRITLSLILTATAVLAQAPPSFEVAAIKPSAPLDNAAMRAGTAHTGVKIDDARVDVGTTTLFRLLCIAYRIKPYQVSGPDWLKTTMFDIQAKIPKGRTADDVPEMLQILLTERFGLKVHHDSRDQAVYALIVGPGGPKLKPGTPEPAPPPVSPDAPKPQEMSVPTAQGDVKITRSSQGFGIEMPGGEIKGKVRMIVNQGTGGQPMRLHVESSDMTMKTFAELLSTGVVNRPVVDVTGLTGSYEVAVDMSQDDAMNVARASVSYMGNGGGEGGNPGAASDPAGSSIITSIQNLGLRLDPRKMPLDLLVIDHMEKMPTAN